MKTTIDIEELKSLNACKEGFNKFKGCHGDSKAKLSESLTSNGWDDIWWYLSEAWENLSKSQQDDLNILGCNWAEKSLVNFEKEFPDDKRPRLAVEAKRKFIAGEISENELSAARSAARSAAESAAESAWSAAESAESAAWSAARSAARSAAWSAWSAARSAAESAESAAWSAARSAARSAAESAESAAWSAARSAAESAESAWSAESAAWSAARSAAMEELECDLMNLFLQWEDK